MTTSCFRSESHRLPFQPSSPRQSLAGLWLAGCCLLLVLSAPLSAADREPPRALSALVKEWSAEVDRAEKTLPKGDLPDEKLEELRAELSKLRLQAIASANDAPAEMQHLREELAALGTPPAAESPPETAAVSAKRKAIGEQIAAAEGAVKEAELIIARADHVLSQLSAQRRMRFAERILSRGQSPLSANVWQKGLPEISDDINLASDSLSKLAASENFSRRAAPAGLSLFLGLVAAFVLVWPIRNWLIRRFGYVELHGEPSHGQRLRTALFTGFIRALLPSAATAVVYLALTGNELIPEQGRELAWTIMEALIFVYLVAAFSRAALAPFHSSWRIVRIHDDGARALNGAITGIAMVFAADAILDELLAQFEASVELTVLHNFVSGLLIAGMLLALLRRKFWRLIGDDGEVSRPKPSQSAWQQLRFLLGLLVLAIPLSAVLGYVALSRLLATQLVLTGGLYAGVILLREIAAESLEHALSRESAIGNRLRQSLALSDDGSEMLRFWLTGLLGALITVLGVLSLLLLWGVGRQELFTWLYTAFFGFKIGNVTLSMADVLLALGLFAGMLTLTRLSQHSLEQRIFPRTRLDVGIRHSVRSAVGYIGFVLAASLAISTIGIDLSNLAIIAGALSVGIGLGLQTIVNNFVSGLILLIERPIKVGDWIVVGDFQGYVKKISVRATEISTFDRASVFIPNSNIIAAPVMNRTYADKIGRVLLPFQLAYGVDSKRVRELLSGVACNHPDVLKSPAPTVLFREFGESGLHMELVAFVYDVDKVKAITSDLCYEIDELFRREGVEVPFPHREVHLGLREDQLDRLMQAWARNPTPASACPADENPPN